MIKLNKDLPYAQIFGVTSDNHAYEQVQHGINHRFTADGRLIGDPLEVERKIAKEKAAKAVKEVEDAQATLARVEANLASAGSEATPTPAPVAPVAPPVIPPTPPVAAPVASLNDIAEDKVFTFKEEAYTKKELLEIHHATLRSMVDSVNGVYEDRDQAIILLLG